MLPYVRSGLAFILFSSFVNRLSVWGVCCVCGVWGVCCVCGVSCPCASCSIEDREAVGVRYLFLSASFPSFLSFPSLPPCPTFPSFSSFPSFFLSLLLFFPPFPLSLLFSFFTFLSFFNFLTLILLVPLVRQKSMVRSSSTIVSEVLGPPERAFAITSKPWVAVREASLTGSNYGFNKGKTTVRQR